MQRTKAMILSGLGGTLEFYDFIVFALLASYISQNFFPADNELLSLLQTFVTFAIGYLARPLGGVVFGHFGDKYGRKKVFIFSIYLMALSTLGIGLIPSYQQIGISAPLLLMFCRVLQGISVGGEIPGALTYISEIVPERKAFACSVIFFFIISGIVLGQVAHAVLTSLLSPAEMLEWGWRIPFIIGGMLGVFSYYLRRDFHESPDFAKIKGEQKKLPLQLVFKYHKKEVLHGIALVALGASLITLLFIFTPSYLIKVLHYQPEDFNWAFVVGMSITAVLTGVFGYFVDHIDHKKTLIVIALISLLFAYPIFRLYSHYGDINLAVFLSIIPLGLIWSVIPVELTNMFPTEMRYTGVGLCYNLGFALFGGITPIIAILLVELTNEVTAPSYYLIATSLAALSSCLFLRKSLSHELR